MKHILFATTGIVLAMAVAGAAAPANADVDVLATINKTKDIEIDQTITITKTLTIDVDVAFELDGGAEAQALLNVTNSGHTVTGPDPESESDPLRLDYEAVTTGSINFNRGVWGVNQDAGNMTNQGNVVSVAAISDGIEVFAQSQVHADQSNTDNHVFEEELLSVPPTTDPLLFPTNKSAHLVDSVNNNTGIINVNQNAGNMNNQSNGVAAAIGIGAEFAMSEGDLGQENSGNFVNELETVKVSSIQGSVNGNTGVVNVNQSTGNMNNQGNVVSVSAIVSGSFIDTQSPGASVAP